MSAFASTQISSSLKVKGILTQEWLHLLQDEAFFHVGAGLIKHEHQQLIDPGGNRFEILCHKVNAINIIRQRITDTKGILDNATLLAIMFLPAFEVRIT